jgi:hypothetical protein
MSLGISIAHNGCKITFRVSFKRTSRGSRHAVGITKRKVKKTCFHPHRNHHQSECDLPLQKQGHKEQQSKEENETWLLIILNN